MSGLRQMQLEAHLALGRVAALVADQQGRGILREFKREVSKQSPLQQAKLVINVADVDGAFLINLFLQSFLCTATAVWCRTHPDIFFFFSATGVMFAFFSFFLPSSCDCFSYYIICLPSSLCHHVAATATAFYFPSSTPLPPPERKV